MKYTARAFVRKFPAHGERGAPFPQTLVILLVAGDVPTLTDEAMHDGVIDDLNDDDPYVLFTINDVERKPDLLGWRVEDILSEGMSGPLRTSQEESDD